MRSIRVIYSFARSGGTLLNQLLGTHNECQVLSEINPTASYKSITNQASEWLSLIQPHEVNEFDTLSYIKQIELLSSRSSELGTRLIIRDWVSVNFLPGCAGDGVIPSTQLEQELYLENAGFRTIPLVITRRSSNVYNSIRDNFPHLNIEFQTFALAYFQYAKAVSCFPIIHLEKLRKHPRETLISIQQLFNLDVKRTDFLLQNFASFNKCTGNNTLQSLSESALSDKIIPNDKSSKDWTDPLLQEADQLFGYE